jgi:hypothetical protein
MLGIEDADKSKNSANFHITCVLELTIDSLTFPIKEDEPSKNLKIHWKRGNSKLETHSKKFSHSENKHSFGDRLQITTKFRLNKTTGKADEKKSEVYIIDDIKRETLYTFDLNIAQFGDGKATIITLKH